MRHQHVLYGLSSTIMQGDPVNLKAVALSAASVVPTVTLRQVLGNLRFTRWYPADRSFPEEDETWSATVRAVRYACAQLRASNTCPHCAGRLQVEQGPSELDYLV